jgi:hypothetical protein
MRSHKGRFSIWGGSLQGEVFSNTTKVLPPKYDTMSFETVTQSFTPFNSKPMKHRGGRKRSKGVPAKKKRFKRCQYTYELKHEVIERYEDGWSIAAISTTLLGGKNASIVRNLVSQWRKDATFIAMMASNVSTAGQMRHRNFGTGTVLSFAAEQKFVR